MGWIVEASIAEYLFLSYGNTSFLLVGSCLFSSVSCAYSLCTMYSWSAVISHSFHFVLPNWLFL